MKDEAVSVEANKQPEKKKKGKIPGLSEGLQLKVIEASSLRH